MKNALYLVITFCLIGLGQLACAKKALPPSPDRFAPNLEKIESVNRTKINLVFDEPIDVSKLTPRSFLIISVTGETLSVRTISSEKKNEVISLFTLPAKPGLHTIYGSVSDRYGNIAHINKRFRASSIIDTITPQITAIAPRRGALKLSKNITLELNFSEPMDTTKTINYFIYPLDKSKIKSSWRSDWQGLYLSYLDSLLPHTTVYFILMPTLADLEQNYLREFGYTFFTSDSVLAPVLVSGDLAYNNQPIKEGIILFSNGKTKAITISDVRGNFSLRLNPAIYNITAIADTNFDNKIDLSTKLIDSIFDTGKTIKIALSPTTEDNSVLEVLNSDF
ncbi:MAG: Ig-like domain-containing protein [candidate division WOR-3 bacterium]